MLKKAIVIAMLLTTSAALAWTHGQAASSGPVYVDIQGDVFVDTQGDVITP
jgi:hypothetical protein